MDVVKSSAALPLTALHVGLKSTGCALLFLSLGLSSSLRAFTHAIAWLTSMAMTILLSPIHGIAWALLKLGTLSCRAAIALSRGGSSIDSLKSAKVQGYLKSMPTARKEMFAEGRRLARVQMLKRSAAAAKRPEPKKYLSLESRERGGGTIISRSPAPPEAVMHCASSSTVPTPRSPWPSAVVPQPASSLTPPPTEAQRSWHARALEANTSVAVALSFPPMSTVSRSEGAPRNKWLPRSSQ